MFITQPCTGTGWLNLIGLDFILFQCLLFSILNFRFDPTPESGVSGALTLMLDANTHLVTASSISDVAQALKILQY